MGGKLFKYLKSFMIESEWNCGNIAEQAKAMFTTLCFIDNIDADTMVCDRLLRTLYSEAAMEDIMDYDNFESFMIELIV